MFRTAIAFLCAVFSGALVGSIVQTQFNLAALVELSVPVTLDVRISTIIHDIVYFSPIFAAVLAVVLLIALSIAGFVARFIVGIERLWFTFAGFIGLLLCFAIVNELAPMPTFIAATRSWSGLLLMAACGGLAGWVFHRLWRPTLSDLKDPVL